MLNLEIVHRNVEAIQDAVGSLAPVGRRELVSLLATREAIAALAREQEHAAIEAEDVMSQADEALVTGYERPRLFTGVRGRAILANFGKRLSEVRQKASRSNPFVEYLQRRN